MSRTELKNKNYSKELAAFIRSGLSKEELRKRLSNYHENDIADMLAGQPQSVKDCIRF